MAWQGAIGEGSQDKERKLFVWLSWADPVASCTWLPCNAQEWWIPPPPALRCAILHSASLLTTPAPPLFLVLGVGYKCLLQHYAEPGTFISRRAFLS